jgi:hypothetical protein
VNLLVFSLLDFAVDKVALELDLMFVVVVAPERTEVKGLVEGAAGVEDDPEGGGEELHEKLFKILDSDQRQDKTRMG